MRLCKTVGYAVQAILFLAEKPSQTAHQIAESTGLPESIAYKILKGLSQKGIVESHRGIKGGYSLNLPLKKINLDTVVDIFGGYLTDRGSPLRGEFNLKVDAIMEEAYQKARKYIKEVTLADLATSYHWDGMEKIRSTDLPCEE